MKTENLNTDKRSSNILKKYEKFLLVWKVVSSRGKNIIIIHTLLFQDNVVMGVLGEPLFLFLS